MKQARAPATSTSPTFDYRRRPGLVGRGDAIARVRALELLPARTAA
jgi:hypothetical protein